MKKVMTLAICVLVAVISFTKVAPWAASPELHTHSVQQTEDKIDTVMALSGGAAAISATLSLLPGDVCTPISQQLAELATYFLLILSALYLEKFLISLAGYITFGILVPVACVLIGAGILWGRKQWSVVAAKILLVGCVIFLIVPASVRLSDLVYQSRDSAVERTLEATDDLEKESDGSFWSTLTEVTTEIKDKASDYLSDMLESLAVMIVTACIIPILVFVFLIWLVKTIFTSNTLTLDRDVLDDFSDKIKGALSKKDE